MDSGDSNITVSVRYRPGNLVSRPPVKVSVDGEKPFLLDNEGVKRITLSPGMHDFRIRCRFRKEHITLDVETPTRITLRFCDECGRISARSSAVSSVDELDYERIGY